MCRIAYRCIGALLVIAVTMVAGGCGGEQTYSAEEIIGWVVDADTGRPIENVNVVAGWQLEGGLEGNSTKGWFKVIEATTDASGKYVIPAWGPETKRVEGVLKDGAPLLIFFRPGYEFHQATNRDVL